MRKFFTMIMAIAFIAVTMILTVPVNASSAQNASGLWQYTPYILDVQEQGCNTLLTTYEDAIWTGTFDGTSTEDGRVWIHCNGKWSFRSTVSFDQVTVDGRSGKLTMYAAGSRPNATADWSGRWVITGGTGELENLRGAGRWWGPGSPGVGEQGDIYYDGIYVFKPN